MFVTYGDTNPALISQVYGLPHGVSYTGRLCFADCVFRAKCSPRFRIENITSSHCDCREFLQTFRIWKDLHVSVMEQYAGELCVMSTHFDGHADNYIQN